jgi:hypothetical protein
MPHHYRRWPLEGKKNETSEEGLESGSQATLCHLNEFLQAAPDVSGNQVRLLI